MNRLKLKLMKPITVSPVIEDAPDLYTGYKDVLLCGHCKGVIDDRWTYCPWCGTDLRQNKDVLRELRGEK